MLIRVRGVNTTTKRNARTGEVTRYYDHRRTGIRLPGDPDSMDFALAVAKLEAMPVGAPPEDKTFKALIQKYVTSSDFSELAESTRTEYRRHIKYVEPVLGPFLVRSIRPRHVEGIKQKFAPRRRPWRRRSAGRSPFFLATQLRPWNGFR